MNSRQQAIRNLFVSLLWINNIEQPSCGEQEDWGIHREALKKGYRGALENLLHPSKEHDVFGMPMHVEDGIEWVIRGFQVSKDKNAPSTGDVEVDSQKFIVRVVMFSGDLDGRIFVYSGPHGKAKGGCFPGASGHPKFVNPYELEVVFDLDLNQVPVGTVVVG